MLTAVAAAACTSPAPRSDAGAPRSPYVVLLFDEPTAALSAPGCDPRGVESVDALSACVLLDALGAGAAERSRDSFEVTRGFSILLTDAEAAALREHPWVRDVSADAVASPTPE